MLQRHYDGLNHTGWDDNSVMILKVDRNPKQRPTEARENSDSDDNAEVDFENGKPPNPHIATVQDTHLKPEPVYGNTRPEDHEVEELTGQAATLQIVTRASPTEVLSLLPEAHVNKQRPWTAPIYENVFSHRMEHMQNQDNECKDADVKPSPAEDEYQMQPRAPGGSQRNISRGTVPDETSDPEDEPNYSSKELEGSLDEYLDMKKKKDLPDFYRELDAESLSAGSYDIDKFQCVIIGRLQTC